MGKEKNFEIKLNVQKESWKSLWLMAKRYGISLEELLEQFVADLTCKAGSGGSDERELAERWYYRSFEMMEEDAFVSYLCSNEDLIEEVMELKERIAKSEQYVYELRDRIKEEERTFVHKDKNGKESLIAHSWKELGYASREAWEEECEEEICEEKEILSENEERLKEIWEDFQRAKASQSAIYEEEMKKLDEFLAEYRKRFC
ncbi:hypothetical protein AALA00_12845 [Lachnospiraceae bacterium 46-15]